MSFPCVDPSSFEMVDGTHLRPRDYMQWRHVVTNFAAATSQSFGRTDVTAKNIALHTVTASWTNSTPIAQYAYGLLTRGPTRVILQAINAAYIQTSVGQAAGVAPADPTASTVFSRFGCGLSFEIPSGEKLYYGTHETRIGSRTTLLGDTVRLEPGEMLKLVVSLRFISQAWNTVAIPETMFADTPSQFETGESQIDIFAYPAI